MPGKRVKKQKAQDVDDNNNEDTKTTGKGRKKAATKKQTSKKGKSLMKGGQAPTAPRVESSEGYSDDDEVLLEESNPKKKKKVAESVPEKEKEKEGEPGDSDGDSLPEINKVLSKTEAAIEVTKKVKAKPVNFKPEIEDALVEWFHDHPALYDRGQKDYMEKAKKTLLYEEKAAELAQMEGTEYVTSAILQRWFAGQRTMFGKERGRSKSGDGQDLLSARRKDRLEKWSFLTCHIVPKKKRQQIGVRII